MFYPTRSQFRACLMGQCVGDALGMPVERQSPTVCQEYVAELRYGSVGTRSHPDHPFGQYTDDSQLSRELIQSFVACRSFRPEDYAQRIAALYSEGRVVGSSRATTQVAQRLAQGTPWNQAGTPPPYARNGSAMRAAPIGLFFYHDVAQLTRAAYQQSQITHQDRRCAAGAVAIATAVAIVLQSPDSIDPDSFLTQLAQQTQMIDGSVTDGLLRLKKWIGLPAETAVQSIAQAGGVPESLQNWEGISPAVIPSVLWSLYSFLRSPLDYWETICTAIAVGGDVDTTAAMAGAISGAYLGLDAIPTFVSHLVNDQGDWGYLQLIDLTDHCYDIVHATISDQPSTDEPSAR
jgi:ADP-ribosylglycohydrolase